MQSERVVYVQSLRLTQFVNVSEILQPMPVTSRIYVHTPWTHIKCPFDIIRIQVIMISESIVDFQNTPPHKYQLPQNHARTTKRCISSLIFKVIGDSDSYWAKTSPPGTQCESEVHTYRPEYHEMGLSLMLVWDIGANQNISVSF